MLKLVNPKHEDWAFISSQWLSLNLWVCCAEICKQFFHLFWIWQKSLHNWFSLLQNDGKQKQVKATEVYLLRRMTEHSFWSVVVRLTPHTKYCMCDDSTPKLILVCVGACRCNYTPIISRCWCNITQFLTYS